MRYFIEIAYNGSAYHGWQKQPEQITVQGVLEAALATALQQKIDTTGAGRTDTGVHALQFFAHFDVEKKIVDIENLIYKLNTILPADVAVRSIFKVAKKKHARFDALAREYTYYVNIKKDPFKQNSAYYVKKKLDIDLMNKAAEVLLKYTDFQTFSKVKTDVKTYNCKLEYAVWKKEGDVLVFRIRADRFLRNMVRSIVGTLLDVGTGKTELKKMEKIIESKKRSKAGKSVPAHALFLTKVEYDF